MKSVKHLFKRSEKARNVMDYIIAGIITAVVIYLSYT